MSEAHRTMYASNRRYEEIKKDRDYWKGRAVEKQTAAFRDGRIIGVIWTNVFWIGLGIAVLFFVQ